jgi:hypothetical protein
MAEAADHIRKTLEEFRQQFAVKIADAARVLAVVNALEDQLSLPRTALSGGNAGVTWNQSLNDDMRVMDAPPSMSSQNIRPDEYLGDAPLEAAKKYLRRFRRAATLDEIADAIARGGAATRGADWRGELDASLLRSTREVVKVKEGTYGLVEFYTEEQLKGLRATRRQRTEPTRKRGRKGKRKKRDGSEAVKRESSEGGG